MNLYISDNRIVKIFQYCGICDNFQFIPYNVMKTLATQGKGIT
jgi:hypothetical protein